MLDSFHLGRIPTIFGEGWMTKGHLQQTMLSLSVAVEYFICFVVRILAAAMLPFFFEKCIIGEAFQDYLTVR
jgi:hypothetical protein